MKNLLSIFSSEKSLTIFPWILSGGSTAWILSARNWYRCSHLPYCSKPGKAYCPCSAVWVQKRKAAFIEPQHVRWSVWSLMSSTTLMWHCIKDWEADNLSNKPTCFGQEVKYDVVAGLAVLRKEFAIWNDVKDESDALYHFQPTTFCKGKSELSHVRGRFVLSSQLFKLGSAVFTTKEGI